MTDQPRDLKRTDLTYDEYLQVPGLLQLQRQRSNPPHHDEMLFIIIHQTYELWFRLVLHELENARTYMQNLEVLRARHFVHRVVEIFKVGVQQIHILETMEPYEFLAFRKELMPASGFQSVQFREVEFLCGMKNDSYLKYFRHDANIVERLQKRFDEPSLRDAFYEMLREQGFDLPSDVSLQHLDQNQEARESLLQALVPIYQQRPAHLAVNLLAESLVSLDQFIALWREHHVRVVQRVIGFKRGTGGSAGVDYLRSTVTKKAFPLLWELRSVLERPE
jgi:tryptophan 2,3-dioxygenase